MRSLAEKNAEPAPACVVVVDLDLPIPERLGGLGYETAMVICERGGIPRSSAIVDLRVSGAALRAQLEPLFRLGSDDGGYGIAPLPDADLPRISVVIPTVVEREDDLELLLAGLARVDYPDVEFILVDNRREIPADDPLPGLVAGRSGVRVVRERRPGISSARNAGIAAATGEIIAFTDDDVRVDVHWLRALGERFARDSRLEALTGLILPAELEEPAQIWFERYYGGFNGERTFVPLTLEADTGGSRALRNSRITARTLSGERVRDFSVYGAGAHAAGANMAYRRATLERLGGFDIALGTGTPSRGGEDLAAVITILWEGGRTGYEPASVVHHRHRRELDELLHQLRGNGLGFTAMLTSLILRDKRHLLVLLAQLPVASRRMLAQSIERVERAGTGRRGRSQALRAPAGPAAPAIPAGASFPRSLVMNELSGYPKGPFAYVRSRRAMRKWAPTQQTEYGEVRQDGVV